MNWNYRVAFDPAAGDGAFRFVECFYDDDKIVGWSEAHPLADETLFGLHGQLQRLLFVVTQAIALENPEAHRTLLNVSDLPADVEGLSFDEDGESESPIP